MEQAFLMSIPYETATSGDKALIEIQRTLAKFGCQSFGSMTDAERGVTMVQFKHRGRVVSLEASWKGYATALMKAHPNARGYRSDRETKALKQAQISVCSVLRDWVKAQTTAIECGAIGFEDAFMAHMLLPSGERLVDRVCAEKLLPAPKE
jgi:hypothetical protein